MRLARDLPERLQPSGLARWLDYAATFLMIGSLFWQTLRFGWRFALLISGAHFPANTRSEYAADRLIIVRSAQLPLDDQC